MASPSRGGVSGVSLAPLAYTLTYGSSGSTTGQGFGWFGPSAPMRPSAPAEVAGRRFDYPTGYNLNTTARAYEPVSFAQLRRLADGYDLLRLVIETRKDQAARMKWAIKPRDSGKPATVKAAAITAFLAKPDGVHPWTDWLRMGLEDVLVLDAWTTFKQRSRAGDLLALEPVDGATIKPILGEDGRVPMPWVQGGQSVWPEAYQQILKGLPAVNYTARELLYRPRNLRTDRVYGFSPVEQVMTTVNIALRRQVMTLEYFTSGTVPDALIGVPETWGPDQIATYQTYWDSLFTDNLAARRRARFVPGKVALHQTSEPQLKGEFDEWLSRVVCFAFSISPQALIKQMNRASADTQKELAEEEGLAPLLDWIKGVLDEVIADDLGAPELEFAWQEDEQIDEAAQAERLRGLTAGGLMRLNEGRKILGLDPDPSPAADVLMVMTGAGLVPIDANTLAGKRAALDAFGPPPASGTFGASPEDPNDRDDGPAAAVAKLLGKFDEAQPRDARGRWTDGSAGGDADETAERAAVKRTVLLTAIGGAVIAGGAIVTAASGGTVPAAVEAAVWIAENYLLGDALVTAGRHIGAHLGYDDEEVAHMLDHLAGAAGFGKVAGNAAAGEQIRDRLSEVVDAALDAMIASIREAGLDADRRSAIVAALEDLRGRLTARIAHLPAPAHKAADAALTKRREWRPADPVPFDRPATRRAMRAIAGRLETALAATRSDVVAGLRGLLKLAKVGPEPDDADALRRALDEFLDEFDFTDLHAVAPEVAEELEAVAADAGRRALAQIGAASREELVDRVNTRAVAAARARAAEMVGMRFDADGRLVPSADARMVITEATRARLRETIASGLERNLGLDAIAEAIEADYAFSAERAARIAEYEVASANGAASLESYRGAAEDGIAVRKAWWAEAGCCAVCQANADAGALELDAMFPSGDDTTPAHPACRCVVVPVVSEDVSVD
ncbi:phage portal protein [Methylobacterium radiotolerans]|uniref:phage portal protein n=1 Tax=Methylobacterium radiotolerans TaxID=31998 RepID=UPI001FCEFE1B|nr:phage portal protein [Methylobacterium radiotolerans]